MSGKFNPDPSTWQEIGRRCDGGGGCVMVDRIAGAVVMWDSKNPYGPRLVFSRREYSQFRRAVMGDSRVRAAARVLVQFARLALQFAAG
jgi:hypothetical protein